MTWQTCPDSACWSEFITNGALQNTKDTSFRAIGDNNPVFAFAVDLGTISDTTSSPTVFAIGMAPQYDAGCVQFMPSASLEDRYSLYLSETSTVDAVSEIALLNFKCA